MRPLTSNNIKQGIHNRPPRRQPSSTLMKLSVRGPAAKGFLRKPSGCCPPPPLPEEGCGFSFVLFFSLIAGHAPILTGLAYFLQNAYGIFSPSDTPAPCPDRAKSSLSLQQGHWQRCAPRSYVTDNVKCHTDSMPWIQGNAEAFPVSL